MIGALVFKSRYGPLAMRAFYLSESLTDLHAYRGTVNELLPLIAQYGPVSLYAHGKPLDRHDVIEKHDVVVLVPTMNDRLNDRMNDRMNDMKGNILTNDMAEANARLPETPQEEREQEADAVGNGMDYWRILSFVVRFMMLCMIFRVGYTMMLLGLAVTGILRMVFSSSLSSSFNTIRHLCDPNNVVVAFFGTLIPGLTSVDPGTLLMEMHEVQEMQEMPNEEQIALQ